MTVAVCDDEKEIRGYIAETVGRFFPDLSVIEYEDASRIADAGFEADILFLDIQMPENRRNYLIISVHCRKNMSKQIYKLKQVIRSQMLSFLNMRIRFGSQKYRIRWSLDTQRG